VAIFRLIWAKEIDAYDCLLAAVTLFFVDVIDPFCVSFIPGHSYSPWVVWS